MTQAEVKLSRIVEAWEPILVDFNQLLDALEELIWIEQRHVNMVRRVQELVKVLIGAEGLRLTRFFVLHDI